MPAKTVPQRELMAIAEHAPGKLYKRNKGAAKMSKGQLSDFASTKGLKKKRVMGPSMKLSALKKAL